MLTCSFVGHLTAANAMDELQIPRALAATIEALLNEDKKFCFYFCGVGWFDRLSEGIVRKAKRSAPGKHIRMILVQPFERPISNPNLFDEVIVPEELRRLPPMAAIPERNRWIVEHSDHLIAYVRSSDGGAAAALSCAQAKGCVIHLL